MLVWRIMMRKIIKKELKKKTSHYIIFSYTRRFSINQAKRAGSKLKSRIVAEQSIHKWSHIIEQMEDQISEVLQEERFWLYFIGASFFFIFHFLFIIIFIYIFNLFQRRKSSKKSWNGGHKRYCWVILFYLTFVTLSTSHIYTNKGIKI